MKSVLAVQSKVCSGPSHVQMWCSVGEGTKELSEKIDGHENECVAKAQSRLGHDTSVSALHHVGMNLGSGQDMAPRPIWRCSWDTNNSAKSDGMEED